MNKLYGGTIIFNTGILILLFGGMCILGIYSVISNVGLNNSDLARLINPLSLLLVSILFLKRGISLVKNKIEISTPKSLFAQVFFYFGGLLLITSIIGNIVSIFVIVQATINKAASGAGAGIGLGLSLIPFVIGASIIEIVKGKSS